MAGAYQRLLLFMILLPHCSWRAYTKLTRPYTRGFDSITAHPAPNVYFVHSPKTHSKLQTATPVDVGLVGCHQVPLLMMLHMQLMLLHHLEGCCRVPVCQERRLHVRGATNLWVSVTVYSLSKHQQTATNRSRACCLCLCRKYGSLDGANL